MFKGRPSLINQVSVLALVALCAIAALGLLDIRDKNKISKILTMQEELLTTKQSLSNIERETLSARIDEITLIQTRKLSAFQNFQTQMANAQTKSAALIANIDAKTSLPQELADSLKITLSKNLNQYEKSVQTLAEIEMRIGLQSGQGLLSEIEVVRNEMMRLMRSSAQDRLLVSFSKIQLSEQEFSRTLNMQISTQLVEDIAVFKADIENSNINSRDKNYLLSYLKKYNGLVTRLMDDTLELELAIAANELHFNRIAPELRNIQTNLDRSLNSIERRLVQQRQISTLYTTLLFGGAFLIISIFTFTQIRKGQKLALRLEQLASKMGEIASGKYPDSKDLPTGQDEVGVLSNAFLSMAEKIHKQIETIQEERKKADAANQAKSAFLANMSHELRTPLNVILGFAQVLQRNPEISQESQHQINLINDSGVHLLALINDVLEMSKIEAGKLALKLTTFDLDRQLEMMRGIFQEKAEKKKLKITISKSPNLPRYIRSDQARLRQILINLLSNAIKFTEAGKVSVNVSLDEVSEPHLMTSLANDTSSSSPSSNSLSKIHLGDAKAEENLVQLIFSVADTGPGIALDECEYIFESFAQTNLGAKFHEGSGLGLAISRQFARSMGGDLTVESVVGEGSVFTFTLPIEPVEQFQNEAQPKEDIEMRDRISANIKKLAPTQEVPRILVVEDREKNRFLMREILDSVGFEVREAFDGEKAIELWKDWQPNLILMDMKMPVMDGVEATRRIRKLDRLQQPTIIALTASAFEEDRQAILNAGCDDFISKPINRAHLLTSIGEHLALHYLYDNSVTQTPEPHPALRDLAPTDLSFMSADWIHSLYEAASQGNDSWIEELIQQIPLEEQDLTKTLTEWVYNYRFDLLMNLADPKNLPRERSEVEA